MEHGNCWSKMAHGLSNRNENIIKNRWNTLIKRYKKSPNRADFSLQDLLDEMRATQERLVTERYTVPSYCQKFPAIFESD